MVKAVDTLWDARDGHDPTVAAATTQRNRSPAPNKGKRGDNGVATPAPKVAPLPPLTFTLFKTLAIAFVNFTVIMPTRLTGVFHTVLGRKTKLPPKPFP